MDPTFQWVMQNGGVCADKDYPYVARQNRCQRGRRNRCKPVATISGYRDIPPNDEKALLTALVEQGPVAVAVEAAGQAFQFYASGVFDGPCGNQLDHAMVRTNPNHPMRVHPRTKTYAYMPARTLPHPHPHAHAHTHPHPHPHAVSARMRCS